MALVVAGTAFGSGVATEAFPEAVELGIDFMDAPETEVAFADPPSEAASAHLAFLAGILLTSFPSKVMVGSSMASKALERERRLLLTGLIDGFIDSWYKLTL